jgi:hypothetical protein
LSLQPSAFSFELSSLSRHPLGSLQLDKNYLILGLWPLELFNGYPYVLLLLNVFGNQLYAHDP